MIHRLPIPALGFPLLIGLLIAPVATTLGEDGFRPIFDGKTLDGWKAPDMRYWSVEDGAITARSSDSLPCTANQFLVWENGELDDFELKLQFRIRGPDSANSGVQIRSRVAEDGHAVGYQADIDRVGRWLGGLYDEHTRRRLLAGPGQRTEIAADGERTTTKLDLSALRVDRDGWNEYHVTARGPRITIRVNGTVTSDVVDGEVAERDLTGKLALQLHSGPPCSVEFRSIRLRRLPLDGGRKKAVFIAGAPSHGCGAHEFNAGVKLLARRLAGQEKLLIAPYYSGRWDADPTSLDNADAIVLYSDGGGRHPFLRDMDRIDAAMRRGVGLMCMHYAVEIPKGDPGQHFLDWIGGFYESGWSSNPHWNAALRTGSDHPITRGVRGEEVLDEWYFCIRFRPEKEGVTSILEATPDTKTRSSNGWPRKPYPHIIADEGRSETLMWAVERPDGGRGVGFTGGHFHHNWAYEAKRRAVLNAILWVCGLEVPTGGVVSDAVTEEELNQNLDPKRKMERLKVPPRAVTRS